MSPIDVDIKPKRIVMPAPAPEVEDQREGGAVLAKEIIDHQLRHVRTMAKKYDGVVDGETVKSLKDMVSVYEMLAKIEREERRANNLFDRLAGMSDAQLEELERDLEKP